MPYTLADLKPGQSAVVSAVGGEDALHRHLLDMGLTPGVKVLLQKTAPMGDPVEIHLRGYALTLRLEDARKITLADEPKA
ncbi:MAG TPA: ferrous iron transport protein A [Candidatus Limiplasma stercoravium]|nr:ferrous iron transport protein A [Candidatus Limiplasma stercoravium]